jgi:hypothetical protein
VAKALVATLSTEAAAEEGSSVLGMLEKSWKDRTVRMALLALAPALARKLNGQAAAQLISKVNILYFHPDKVAINTFLDDDTCDMLWRVLDAFVSDGSIISKIPPDSMARFATDVFLSGLSSDDKTSSGANFFLRQLRSNLSSQTTALLAAAVDEHIESRGDFHPEDQEALIPLLSVSSAVKAADRLRPQLVELVSHELNPFTDRDKSQRLEAFVSVTSKAGKEPAYRSCAVRDLLFVIALPPVSTEVSNVRIAATIALSQISGLEFSLHDIATIATWARENIGVDPASIRPPL